METDMLLVATNDARWMLRNEARYRNQASSRTRGMYYAMREVRDRFPASAK